MIIKCPECQLQVSDKALACPHCGYPLTPTSEPRKQRKSNKRRRLPNGFGQISEIKGRFLRKPFRALVTIGKNEEGKLIIKPLKPESYFATYNDAYEALAEYNRHPYDLSQGIKVKDLYEKWLKEYSNGISEKTIKNIKSVWPRCSAISEMPIQEVRTRQCKSCVETSDSYHVQKQTKRLLKRLFDYAMQYELTDRNYAQAVLINGEVIQETKEKAQDHIAFTDEELNILWNNLEYPYVKAVLIQCYMGWRPLELCILRLNDVDIENWIIIGGMKTEAGKGRRVPVNEKIRGLVKEAFEIAKAEGSETLFICKDSKSKSIKMTYDKYRDRFDKIIEDLKLNSEHRPHDPRKTFVTLCKKAGVDEYAIKYLAGHYIKDLTERVYTDREIEWLRAEISKI